MLDQAYLNLKDSSGVLLELDISGRCEVMVDMDSYIKSNKE
jgi:hypothetical protein